MEHVATPIQATPISQAQALNRPGLRSLTQGVSPVLGAVIAAVQATQCAYRQERLVGAAMRDAFPPRDFPTDAELRAAADAVPAPECLLVPYGRRQPVAVLFDDGSKEEIGAPKPLRVLTADEIDTHFADSPDCRAEARKALAEYDRDRGMAIGAMNQSACSPERLKAEKEHERWCRRTLYPLHDAFEAAKKELYAFNAESAADRLAQTMALFGIEGGKISRTGRVTDAGDAFEGREGARLASIMFEALRAAAEEGPADDFDAGAWIDAVERLPGHAVDHRGVTYLEPHAWADGDYSRPPVGHALWAALSASQKRAVCVEGRRRHPVEPLDLTNAVYTPFEFGGGAMVLHAAE